VAFEPDWRPALDEPPAEETGSGVAVRRSAVIVLILAIATAAAFVFFRGGLTYPLQPAPGAGPASQGAVRPPSPSPSAVAPSASIVPSATPSPSLAPTESASSSAEPSPTSSPRRTATPRPTSDRFAVLERCPSTPDCWIYTVRSGDNLFSIANWFGVSLERIEAMNPWVKDTGLRAGQDLKIPTPTR
jgi:LysM repeat protein